MASRLRRSSRSSRSDDEDEEKFMSKSSGGFSPPKAEYFGWVYHLGVNKIGREYCHLRFLRVRGKYVEMYKRDPHEHPGVRPIRQGTMGHTLMVEEQGRRRVHNGDLYVIRFYNRLDESGKGEIACSTAGEAQKWMEAFDQAKQQADYELSRAKDAREKLNVENEINLEGHRRRVRKYAQELRRFTRIGSGPETLLNKPPGFCCNDRSGDYIETDGDVIEAHRWRCVWTLRGIRIFEDIADSKGGKHVLVKSVGVIDASADTLFEVLMSLDPSTRYEWDVLTGDLELIESLNGHYDVLYGTYDTKYFTRWKSKKDFVFSRQWFCAQDGTYTILHFPSGHRKKPTRSGYQRTKVNPSTWEIKNLTGLPASQSPKCLLTLMLEIKSSSWNKWKKSRNSKFETSFPFALLCLVAGVKEYVAANPSLISKCHSTVVDPEGSYNSFDSDMSDDFHDAKTIETLSDSEDSDEEIEVSKQDREGKLKDRPWSARSLMLEKTSGLKHELDSTVPPLPIDAKQFHSSLPQEKDTDDKNCWSDPGGIGFMVRGKTYLKDNAKVKGGDPLLKLIAVDWLRAEKAPDNAALRPSCAVRSDAGRKLPFIFVINLQIPAKPNYSMILYFAANRPVKKDSLLGKFIDGTDMFRDSRFKLIPSIVKGYWMVKKAVGTKACLLGKAVTCRYLRQDNFLEIDVDIGSSSVARGVINLVLGHVTSLVVDLAILLEANEESELPEYLLGTVRLNSINPSSAEQV